MLCPLQLYGWPRRDLTHIAAVLFYLEAVVRIQGTMTCTESQCEWVIPAYVKSIDYQPIKNIDLTSASGKKRKLDEMIEEIASPSEDTDDSVTSTTHFATRSTDEEMSHLFETFKSYRN